MYKIAYHDRPLRDFAFLVTGGAGFIGSNLVEYLLRYGAGLVRVLDNGSTGFIDNLAMFRDCPSFEFLEGDITDPVACRHACEGITHLSHQAALGSVQRSVTDPMQSHNINVTGFLTILLAARDSGVRRIVYASSSSIYGDILELPKVEERVGWPLSPYAVTKVADEHYARVFGKLYGLETIGLRYFNVFGPRQRFNRPYAAVIPLFMQAALEGKAPRIYGDGEQTRDFTFVENVVQANIRAMLTMNSAAFSQSFNIATGKQVSLNDIWNQLCLLSGSSQLPEYSQSRETDIRDSLASISKASVSFGYEPRFSWKESLDITWEWFRQQNRQ